MSIFYAKGETMLQVALHDTYQLTLPKAIIEKADIHQDDVFAISYEKGKITLVKIDNPQKNLPTQKNSIMDFIGSTKGLYGNTTEEIDAYIKNERDSWD